MIFFSKKALYIWKFQKTFFYLRCLSALIHQIKKTMIEICNMSFTYSKNKPDIFHELNLQMKGGHIYGLLGKNGAGKTTLLKLMTGLRFPQNGNCNVLGMESRKRQSAMMEDLYFLTEEIWLPDTNISGYLRMYAAFYPKFDQEIFERCLVEFEIDRHNNLKRMSFGQRKKVAIAFALATQCRILIMDEPTNGLDIPSKGQFRKMAAEVINDERCIVLSTHQVRDLESLIDSVIILENRQILLNKSTEDICQQLLFKTLFSLDNQPGLLYSEFTPKGYLAVFRNTEDMDSKLDLEVLFNFTTQNPALTNELFKK
jgi:ABC-2 type transport system ATP-binding protein